jgi:hypothetical protein
VPAHRELRVAPVYFMRVLRLLGGIFSVEQDLFPIDAAVQIARKAG